MLSLWFFCRLFMWFFNDLAYTACGIFLNAVDVFFDVFSQKG